MKSIIISFLLMISGQALAAKQTYKQVLAEYRNECRTTEVHVDEIVRNSHIKGHVKGLSPAAYSKFKVVFYVKTNRWYVHPYTYQANQGEGYSYSNIHANGEFQVKTVLRNVPSSKLAVVVVPKSYTIASQRFWLKPLFGIFGGVLRNQCSYTLVDGTGDFFM